MERRVDWKFAGESLKKTFEFMLTVDASKYIVGADGGASTVRQLANISMEGSNTVYQWVRMDGKMKTSMPDADIGFAAVETAHHGNVLWVKLDKDAYRIGFAVTPPLLAKYPNGLTEEDALKEAQECMKPFTLAIERLDWWTQYKIKQTVATKLQHDNYVLLAGDAAHTHSSGFAQGMNTGIHDSLNLIWKLSGVLKAWYKPDVLATYNSERHAAAKHLISIDMEAATLISGVIQGKYQPLGLDADTLLMKVQNDNMNFSCGLGVKYSKNFLNKDLQATVLRSGSRAPDALIRSPGVNVLFRLQERILHAQPNGWSLLVFAGDYRYSRDQVNATRKHFDGLQKRPGVLRIATILSGPSVDSWTAFDGPPLGKLYFDADGSAHAKYGVSLSSGAVVVIRPDSIVAFATTLGQGEEIPAYFDRIFA
jgi:phenol 2-monooxygenase